jgi:RNA polymerase sigma factor (TIGR02999 family)
VELTRLLQRLEAGDPDAIDLVIPLVYDELKRLARSHLRREARNAALETTALVHEVFLKLVRGKHPAYENRAHFYGIAAKLMRQVLVDAARSRAAEKRGRGQEVSLAHVRDEGVQPSRSIVALDDVLRQLEKTDPLKAELIQMRYFGGMTAQEAALALGKPIHSVRRELRLAQAWLRKEMADKDRFQELKLGRRPRNVTD